MNIAIVEDDLLQSAALRNWLEGAGHHCNSYESGVDFTHHAAERDHQLLILDWELPGMSGIELLEWLRNRRHDTTPIIFVTSRDTEEDIVHALHKGADDYLIKPARKQELLARIAAVARRGASTMPHAGGVSYGRLQLDPQRREILLDEQPLGLTQKEYDLASYLLNNIGRLIPRDELLEKVWGHSANVHTRTVDTHISRLRKKLDLNQENGWRLSAVYQFGYRLDHAE